MTEGVKKNIEGEVESKYRKVYSKDFV